MRPDQYKCSFATCSPFCSPVPVVIPRFPRSIYAIKTCSSCVAYFLLSIAFSRFCPPQSRSMLLILRISASSALSALVSQASVRPLSGGGDSRTGTHQNEQSVGTADCVAITLRTFANRCHVRRWKPLVTSLETRLSPKASVSAAICCAVLHSEPTISEIRAVFVACA